MKSTPPPARFTALSLFSGALGFGLGVVQTGRFRLIGCAEMDPAACDTLRANRDAGRLDSGLPIFEGDITDLDPEAVMGQLGVRPGEVDLLFGGPPCEPYSNAGRRRSVADPRGMLLWQFQRLVAAIRPRVFVMENVRGLMAATDRQRPPARRPNRGGPPLAAAEVPGVVVERLMGGLPADYRVDAYEVNSAHHGTPQARERVLFFGNRLGLVAPAPAPTHGTAPLLPFRTLGDALAGLAEPDPLVMYFSPRKKRFLAMIPPGGNWRSLPPEAAQEWMGKSYHLKGGRSAWGRRLSFDLPCPTILTMPNHAGTALCHPTETRALSLRECARVQEFPDDWEFRGRKTQQYAQVGNAVPVRLAMIAGRVAAAMLDGAAAPAGPATPRLRVAYLASHLRTRKWYSGGRAVVRATAARDGAAGSAIRP